MKTILPVLLTLFLLSCSAEKAFQAELQEIVDTSRDPYDLKQKLLELDQRVPDKAQTKINLGILSLTLGEVEEAGIYLARA